MTSLTREQILSIYWTVFKEKTLQFCALFGGLAGMGSALTFCVAGGVVAWSLFATPPQAVLVEFAAGGPTWAVQTFGGMVYYLVMYSKEYGVARILCITAAALLTQCLMLGYLTHLANIA